MLRLRFVARIETRVLSAPPRASLHAAHRHCAANGARWTCPCGFHNYAFATQCFRCSAARGGAPDRPKASPMALLGVEETAAQGRGAAASAVVTPAEGVWMCALCNTFNNAERSACIHCGEQRPGPRQVRQAAASVGADDSSPSFLARGFARPKQEFRSGDWYCGCGTHNFARNTQCRGCGQAPPAGGAAPFRTGGRSGDWVCRECGKYNFARRTVCMQCSHPQPPQRGEEVGKACSNSVSEGWVCSACHSMNPGDVGDACVICGVAK